MSREIFLFVLLSVFSANAIGSAYEDALDRITQRHKQERMQRDLLESSLAESATVDGNAYAQDRALARQAKIEYGALPEYRNEALQAQYLKLMNVPRLQQEEERKKLEKEAIQRAEEQRGICLEYISQIKRSGNWLDYITGFEIQVPADGSCDSYIEEYKEGMDNTTKQIIVTSLFFLFILSVIVFSIIVIRRLISTGKLNKISRRQRVFIVLTGIWFVIIQFCIVIFDMDFKEEEYICLFLLLPVVLLLIHFGREWIIKAKP